LAGHLELGDGDTVFFTRLRRLRALKPYLDRPGAASDLGAFVRFIEAERGADLVSPVRDIADIEGPILTRVSVCRHLAGHDVHNLDASIPRRLVVRGADATGESDADNIVFELWGR